MEGATLDALLGGRWHEMREALTRNDTDRAARFFAASTREAFREVFATLSEETLTRMARDMADVRLIGMRRGTVEYDLRKAEVGNDGEERVYSYYLMFVRDEDGLWRVRAF